MKTLKIALVIVACFLAESSFSQCNDLWRTNVDSAISILNSVGAQLKQPFIMRDTAGNGSAGYIYFKSGNYVKARIRYSTTKGLKDDQIVTTGYKVETIHIQLPADYYQPIWDELTVRFKVCKAYMAKELFINYGKSQWITGNSESENELQMKYITLRSGFGQ